MLIQGQVKNALKAFITKANQTKQADLDKTVDDFCAAIESVVFTAIKSATITLPPGSVKVAGSPAAQVNVLPIIIQGMTT